MNHEHVETTAKSYRAMTPEIPGILRAVAIGCTIGAVSVFVGVSGALYLSEHDLGLALALGGMSAFWGGLGFGSMMGGTIHLIRHSEESYSSAEVHASERAGRALEVIESPAAASTHRADASPLHDPRQVQRSSQVA